MSAPVTQSGVSTVASTVAPEDLECGEYVAVLNFTCELPSYLWDENLQGHSVTEPVRLRLQARDGGTPLKIKGVCLPFVFVKAPSGEHRSLDVRQVQLVRLDRTYARRVVKTLSRQSRSQGADRPCEL